MLYIVLASLNIKNCGSEDQYSLQTCLELSLLILFASNVSGGIKWFVVAGSVGPVALVVVGTLE